MRPAWTSLLHHCYTRAFLGSRIYGMGQGENDSTNQALEIIYVSVSLRQIAGLIFPYYRSIYWHMLWRHGIASRMQKKPAKVAGLMARRVRISHR